MNLLKNNVPYIIANSFIVDSKNLNAKSALSICKILETITNLNDEAIVAIFGTLDFSKIILENFYLDFLGSAFLDDVVTFHSYINIDPGKQIEITVKGNKKNGQWSVPIVNGSFVYAVKNGMEIKYSLS